MAAMTLLDRSAMDLARMVRRREVSPVELVDAHIAQIEAVNPSLNAVIATRYDQARAEARAAERQVMQASDPASLPPLLGLPHTAKEYIMAEGMPLTAGVWRRRGVRAERDATTVARLRRAGAILVGITNVPEGGLWMETYNDLYGRTVNPWSAAHTAGGTSKTMATGSTSWRLARRTHCARWSPRTLVASMTVSRPRRSRRPRPTRSTIRSARSCRTCSGAAWPSRSSARRRSLRRWTIPGAACSRR